MATPFTRTRLLGKILSLSAIALILIYAVLPQKGKIDDSSTKPSLSDSSFGLPMCDPSGECHERPDIPSPRTIYSARTREQYDLWWNTQAALNQSAAQYVARRAEGGSVDNLRPLVLMGDSITEHYLGTSYGRPSKRAEGIPEVLSEVTKSEGLDPLVLAISGDQTQHLLYRLQHGNLPQAIADDANAAFVVLIGTNNLGTGILPRPTAEGVVAVAKYVLSNTVGRLVIVEVLPRGDGKKYLPKLCPPRCNSDGEPFKSFFPAVEKVNTDLRESLPYLSKQYDDRLSLVDCGSSYLINLSKDEEVDVELMPDRLHPNADGQRILLQCVVDCINGKC